MICMEQGLLTLPGENDLGEQRERERDFLWERYKYRVIVGCFEGNANVESLSRVFFFLFLFRFKKWRETRDIPFFLKSFDVFLMKKYWIQKEREREREREERI